MGTFPTGQAVGEVGEEETGPTSKEPLLSPLPSSELPALKKPGTVCYAGAGMYRVFHMASVQSYTGRFIFILPSSALASCCQSPLLSSAHLPPDHHPHPTMGPARVVNSWWGGYTASPGGEKLNSQRMKPLVPFLSPNTQPWDSLQGHGPSTLGVKVLWRAYEVDPLLREVTLRGSEK